MANDAAAAVYAPEKIAVDSCVDSDGGIDFYTRGTVDTRDSGSTGHYNDLCWNGSGQLHEWYCKGMQPVEVIENCKNGCQDGACLRQDIDRPDDWDVAVKFDVANQGPIYPFRGLSGVVGETYYDKLNGTDDIYRETAYANTCPSHWNSDPNAKRALGWYAERKSMDNGDFKILIRGTAPADCNYSSPGESKGELLINESSGWKIKDVVKCSVQDSNKGQNVECTNEDNYSLKFSAGSNCGGCCACADSGSLDIEVILEKEGGSVGMMPRKQCTDSDGGQNSFEQGKTTYMNYTNTDNCASKNKLVEYYCDEKGEGLSIDLDCENGCKGGKCLKKGSVSSDAVPDESAPADIMENIMDSGMVYLMVAILGLILGIVVVVVVALSKKP